MRVLRIVCTDMILRLINTFISIIRYLGVGGGGEGGLSKHGS